jgi:hypothetical protein
MKDVKLGKLECVPLREVWLSEASDFTPWLAQEENLGELGKAIGVELELEAQEKDVGPFRADILCKTSGVRGTKRRQNDRETRRRGARGCGVRRAGGW